MRSIVFVCIQMFFCGGKMFLKKRQNLLTIGNILLKSIYRDKNTFVYDTKTKKAEEEILWLN